MKKILCFVLAILLLTTVFSMSVLADEYEYESAFVEYFEDYLREFTGGLADKADWYTYNEICYYYGEDRSICVTADPSRVPDYVLIKAKINIFVNGTEMVGDEIFGDYVLKREGTEGPNTLNYYIYIPNDNEILPISNAVAFGNCEDIDRLFSENYIESRLIGDVDKDRKLNIKDATLIQKCLAGIAEFDFDDSLNGIIFSDERVPFYLSDFNRDGVRNIKDATAIQKHIAGLPY